MHRAQGRRRADLSAEGLASTMELADFEKMEQIRARVDAIVQDPATAEALKPYYHQFCKRPCFHDEYLDTFNRPNVTLVDTEGRGVDAITESGVVVDGVEYELDCLIFATGFEVGTDYTRRAGYDLIGRDGADAQREVGRRRLHAATACTRHGFPNCFIFSIAQSGFTRELPAHAQRAVQARRLHPRARASTTTSHASRPPKRPRTPGCRRSSNWRMNARSSSRSARPATTTTRASPGERSLRNGSYGAGPIAFVKLLEDWRAEGSLAGLQLTS